jgi:hypothetical protein
MVNSCVNPACRTQFRLLHSGDLYVIERPATATGLFWICSDCASSFRPYLNADGKVSFEPREDGAQERSPQLQATLRLVAHARRHMPWRHDVPAGLGPMTNLPGAWGAPTHGPQL